MDAGLHPSDLEGSRTDVYVSISISEAEVLVFLNPQAHVYQMTGLVFEMFHVLIVTKAAFSYFVQLYYTCLQIISNYHYVKTCFFFFRIFEDIDFTSKNMYKKRGIADLKSYRSTSLCFLYKVFMKIITNRLNINLQLYVFCKSSFFLY